MIIGFDQDVPVELAGHKGHSLSRMWQAGLPVPQGFCVTWDQIETMCLSGLDLALSVLEGGPFAVRSSAIQEDSLDTSFAGMLLSRLNVNDAAGVIYALQEIRDSASAPAAVGYSHRLNVEHSSRIAAVVQLFVPAESSGVLFMNDGYFVVEACWGLGPGVVEGLVRPDRWIVSTDGHVVSAQIADKDIAVVPAGIAGITQTPVDPPCRRRPCLRDESLRELSRLAIECGQLFGRPQDIEWAVCDNRVWLLQSRPIKGDL